MMNVQPLLLRTAVAAMTFAACGVSHAAAQGAFAMPAGCEAYVTVQKLGCTVQKLGCTVTHLFHCQGDPAGQQRRVDLDDVGLTYMGIIDAEAQWIQSFHASTGETTALAPGAADPASFTDLLANGRDKMDFQTNSDMWGLTSYVGEDRLTGNTVVIDGITLQETAFNMVSRDESGALIWEITGNEYIHAEWRTFLSGIRTYTSPDNSVTENNTPVEFIFPGEAGFLNSTPRYECDVVVSQAVNLTSVTSVSSKRN